MSIEEKKLERRANTYNFSAGPAMLPTSVLVQAQHSLLDWHNTGTSIMEISHRCDAFMSLAQETCDLFKELLHIPEHYKVLFFQGGARGQFSAVASNLLGAKPRKKKAQYFISGYWSKLAAKEASRMTKVITTDVQVDGEEKSILQRSSWEVDNDAAYYHVTTNETIDGIQTPELGHMSQPVVSDMTSYLLSETFNVEDYQLIYASAQKNLGISGITFVIVDPEYLVDIPEATPSIFDYKLQIAQKSLYNTSPTFPLYMTNLMLKWVVEQGGVGVMANLNEEKAEFLYQYIDQSDFYVNNVDKTYRSKMNIPFLLKDSQLESKFLREAQLQGLVGLQGHRSVGGLRASIYNSMPLTGIKKLVEFMEEFAAN